MMDAGKSSWELASSFRHRNYIGAPPGRQHVTGPRMSKKSARIRSDAGRWRERSNGVDVQEPVFRAVGFSAVKALVDLGKNLCDPVSFFELEIDPFLGEPFCGGLPLFHLGVIRQAKSEIRRSVGLFSDGGQGGYFRASRNCIGAVPFWRALKCRNSLPNAVKCLKSPEYSRDILAPSSPVCVLAGSTDLSNVSQIVPTAFIIAACMPRGVPLHHWSASACADGSAARKGMIYAAMVLAKSGYRLMTSPVLLEQVKRDFARGGNQF